MDNLIKIEHKGQRVLTTQQKELTSCMNFWTSIGMILSNISAVAETALKRRYSSMAE